MLRFTGLNLNITWQKSFKISRYLRWIIVHKMGDFVIYCFYYNLSLIKLSAFRFKDVIFALLQICLVHEQGFIAFVINIFPSHIFFLKREPCTFFNKFGCFENSLKDKNFKFIKITYSALINCFNSNFNVCENWKKYCWYSLRTLLNASSSE